MEKLTSLLVRTAVNAVDDVVYYLGHIAVSRLQKKLERVHSNVLVPYPAASTRVPEVAATGISYKGDRNEMTENRNQRGSSRGASTGFRKSTSAL